MNKFALIAILAFVAVAAASPIPDELDVESEIALSPSDDDEVAGLDGITQVFSSYCLNARDSVVNDIKARTNEKASNIFGIFFNSAEQLGLEAVEVNQEATRKIAAQIANPSTPIEDVDPTNEIESIIAEGQKKIQSSPNQPMSIFAGVVSTLSATKNAVTTNVMTKLSQIRDGFGLATLTNAVKNACAQFDQYDQMIHAQFEEAKSAAASANPAIAGLSLENVNCVTTKRIIRLDGICKLAMAIQNPLVKVISYKPIPTESQ